MNPQTSSAPTRALADFAFGSHSRIADTSRPLAWLSPEELSIDLADPEQRRFGDYELVEQIGQGGMGVVYRARQLGLERDVAFKLLAAGPWASEEFVERFRREARSAARMQHPNIVEIYEFGHRDGLNYFSMRLVEGQSLAESLASSGPLEPREAARLLRILAEAMDYAHRLGVLHLDLKPGNVLLTHEGEPLIADFGLARRIDAGHEGGEIAGTPSYMAPEQALLESHPLSASTDIWGLGAVLYECLTGRPPFLAPDAQRTLERVVSESPDTPRDLNRGIPADLNAICMRCLEKDPSQRYASARELADDVQRHLEGRPVSVRRPGLVERLLRWARREPRLAAVSTVLISTLLLALLAAVLAINHITSMHLTWVSEVLGSQSGRIYVAQDGVNFPVHSLELSDSGTDASRRADTRLQVWFRQLAAERVERDFSPEAAEVMILTTLNGAPARRRMVQHLAQQGRAGDALLALITLREASIAELGEAMDSALLQVDDPERLHLVAAACHHRKKPVHPVCHDDALAIEMLAGDSSNAAAWIVVASLPGVPDTLRRELLLRASASGQWISINSLNWRRLDIAYRDPAFSVQPERESLRMLASEDAIRAHLAYTGNYSLRSPSTSAIKACASPALAEQDPELEAACTLLIAKLQDASDPLARMTALGLRFDRNTDIAEREELRRMRRVLLWQALFAGPTSLLVLEAGATRRFLDDHAALGEYESLLRVLDNNGLPRKPHPSWTLEDKSWFQFASERTEAGSK